MAGETPAKYRQFVADLLDILEDRDWHNMTEIINLDEAASREMTEWRLADLTDYGLIQRTTNPVGGATQWVKLTIIGAKWLTPAGWDDPEAPWNCF